MYLGKTLFAQLTDFLPWKTFHRIIDHHDGGRYVKSMTCADQFRALAFAQLSYRESPRDIEVCLSAQAVKLYHTPPGRRPQSPTLPLARASSRLLLEDLKDQQKLLPTTIKRTSHILRVA